MSNEGGKLAWEWVDRWGVHKHFPHSWGGARNLSLLGGHTVLWDEPLISLLGYTDVR